LPDGLTSPNSTAAIASPSSWPGYHASSTAATESSQGIVTADPVFSTTIVLGLAAATAAINAFCSPGSAMSLRSAPSDSKSPANTTATSEALASATASSISDTWPGNRQPRPRVSPPPLW